MSLKYSVSNPQETMTGITHGTFRSPFPIVVHVEQAHLASNINRSDILEGVALVRSKSCDGAISAVAVPVSSHYVEKKKK